MKIPAALAALALLACSPASIAPPDGGIDSGVSIESGAPGDSGANDASSPVAVCKEYAYTRCTALQGCSPTQMQIEFGDVATCETSFTDSCVLASAAPSSGSTLAHVQACTTAISGWVCSDLIYSQNTPPACATPQGSLTNGAPCTVNSQCQTAFCLRPAGAACGACAPAPNPGDPCTSSAQCGTGGGLTCVGSTQKCTAFSQLGASCNGSQPCIDGLNCASGVCATGVSQANMPCVFDGAGCDKYAGLACNAATATCQTLQLVGGGQACGDVANQVQDCKAGECTRGVCVVNAPIGGACDIVAGPSCIGFALCFVNADGGTGGTCQIAGSATCD
jgi:hypothetical protein